MRRRGPRARRLPRRCTPVPLLRLTQRVLRGGHGLLAGVQVPVLALRNRRAACNKNDVFQHRLVGVCSMQSVLYNLVGFFYLIFNK